MFKILQNKYKIAAYFSFILIFLISLLLMFLDIYNKGYQAGINQKETELFKKQIEYNKKVKELENKFETQKEIIENQYNLEKQERNNEENIIEKEIVKYVEKKIYIDNQCTLDDDGLSLLNKLVTNANS